MNPVQDLPSIAQPGLAGQQARAATIAQAGGVGEALAKGLLPATVTVSLSEGLVLGLLKQGVSKYLVIFGHGSTDLAEVLRVYTEAGVTQVFSFRNEVEMAHAGTALAWVHGQTCAVVTSIGPGALQAMAGSLAAASNGVGVYHLYGDETTHGEGYNMQQVPKPQQGLYGQLTALMGQSYVLHTPEALRDALRRGTQCVHHPSKAGPFYLMLPINTQPQLIHELKLDALPERLRTPRLAVGEPAVLTQAAELIRRHPRTVMKIGGGGRAFAPALRALAERIGAAVVLSPGSAGVLPDAHPQNMLVGGSKGSISGNFAMEYGELLIVVGSRAVCQADCSGVGYPNAQAVININADLADAAHYNRTLALQGDIGVVVEQLLPLLEPLGVRGDLAARQAWLADCAGAKAQWKALLAERQNPAPIADAVWPHAVLTQPAAIKIVCDFAKSQGALKFFDAGDVQANGFQTVEDDEPFQTYTETGASYMGFATCALAAQRPGARQPLRRGLHRRRLVHDEPAGADQRRRTRCARPHRHLRQSPHGRHLGPAVGPVRCRFPHERQRGRRLRATRRQRARRARAARRAQRRRVECRTGAGRCARRTERHPPPGLRRARPRRRPGRLWRLERRQLVRRRAAPLAHQPHLIHREPP
jgi:3D-(3,5/4)-trihydroxycyclohexane-1,2-dione acylhydrolase (decyclizing)